MGKSDSVIQSASAGVANVLLAINMSSRSRAKRREGSADPPRRPRKIPYKLLTQVLPTGWMLGRSALLFRFDGFDDRHVATL